MAGSLAMAWDEALTQYDFGPGHPLAPVRVALTVALARDLDVFSAPSMRWLSPSPATDAELATVHDDDYIDAVRTYNTTLKTFPGLLWASTVFRNNKPMAEFTAADTAQQPPVVKF